MKKQSSWTKTWCDINVSKKTFCEYTNILCVNSNKATLLIYTQTKHTLGETTLMSSFRKRNFPTSLWNLFPQFFTQVSRTLGHKHTVTNSWKKNVGKSSLSISCIIYTEHLHPESMKLSWKLPVTFELWLICRWANNMMPPPIDGRAHLLIY